ncbi:MAG TPA: hypothetical protein VJ794_05190 [Gemmatimonadales bacterium]|nr:hypothetical protein [Gemmatimonadales bacterium]
MLSHSLRRLAGTALTALAMGTAACGGDSDSTGPADVPANVPADVSGSYDLTGLRTLGNLGGGGAGLPVTFTDGGGSSLRFESGHLELLADGTYSLEVEAEFNGGAVTLTDEGVYDVSGNAIDFTPTGDPARMRDGVVSGSSITAETQFGGIPFEMDLAK